MTSAAALLAELHGAAFRRLSLEVGDAGGLTVAAREARRLGRVSPGLMRKLERVDIAMHYAQHISMAKVAALTDRLERELVASQSMAKSLEDPWWTAPDPWAPASAARSVANSQPAAAIQATPSSVADVATQSVPGVAHIGVGTSRPRRCSTASGPGGDLDLDGIDGGEYDAGLSYDPAVDDYDFLAVRARWAADLEVWHGASVDGLMDLPPATLRAMHVALGFAIAASSAGSEAGSSVAGSDPPPGGATRVGEAYAGASLAWRVGDRVCGPFPGFGTVAYLTPRGTRFEVDGPGRHQLFESAELWTYAPSAGSIDAPWSTSEWRYQPWRSSRRRR